MGGAVCRVRCIYAARDEAYDAGAVAEHDQKHSEVEGEGGYEFDAAEIDHAGAGRRVLGGYIERGFDDINWL